MTFPVSRRDALTGLAGAGVIGVPGLVSGGDDVCGWEHGLLSKDIDGQAKVFTTA